MALSLVTLWNHGFSVYCLSGGGGGNGRGHDNEELLRGNVANFLSKDRSVKKFNVILKLQKIILLFL